MLSHKPSKIVLILVASLFATGCALKPRQASRFHNTSDSGGGCDCYTCRADNNVSDYSYTENVSMAETIHGETFHSEPVNVVVQEFPQETNITLDSPQVLSVDPPSLPTNTLPRQPYQFGPVTEPISEPVVSNDFAPLNTAPEPANPVNEVKVESSPSDQLLDLDSNEPTPLEGGSFKAPTVEKKVVKVEPTPAVPIPEPTPTPAPAKAPTTAPIPKPTSIPAPTPKSSPVSVPTKPLLPPTPTEIPKPKSIFKPGESFKPGKSFKPIKTSSTSSGSFMLKTQTTTPVIDPFASVASQPQSNGNKLVLRANPVERNVVFTPSRSASKVAVPALQANFKHKSDANWLREVPQMATNTVDQSTQPQAYESTASANLATQVVERIPAPVQMQVAAEQPKPTLPVRLRAIPMDEGMIKGQQVDVRFRQHTPVQHGVVNHTQPAATPEPVAMIPMPLSSASLPEANELELPLATPELDAALEHTARATDVREIVTPPWRIK